MEQLAEKCRENVHRYTYQTVSIGLGGEVEEVGQLSASYAQALSALANTFLNGGNSVYTYVEDAVVNAVLPRYSYDKEKELLYCLRSANLSKAEEQLDHIWHDWITAPATPNPSIVKTLCLELAHSIHRIFSEKATDSEVKTLENKLADMSSAVSLKILAARFGNFAVWAVRICNNANAVTRVCLWIGPSLISMEICSEIYPSRTVHGRCILVLATSPIFLKRRRG